MWIVLSGNLISFTPMFFCSKVKREIPSFLQIKSMLAWLVTSWKSPPAGHHMEVLKKCLVQMTPHFPQLKQGICPTSAKARVSYLLPLPNKTLTVEQPTSPIFLCPGMNLHPTIQKWTSCLRGSCKGEKKRVLAAKATSSQMKKNFIQLNVDTGWVNWAMRSEGSVITKPWVHPLA